MWATAQGSFTSGGAHSDAMEFFDLSDGATNAPTIFQFNTGPNGAVGMEILLPGVYRMWQYMKFQSNQAPGTVGANFAAAMYFDFNAFFGTDTEFTNGINTYSLESAQDQVLFYTRQYLDLFVYDLVPMQVTSNGPPYNVIEFGMAQNTTVGGDWNYAIMLEVLPFGAPEYGGDFSGVTYLP